VYDIATDHAPALSAAILLLAFSLVFVRLLRFLAGREAGWAVRFLEGFNAASPMAKLAAALMLVSGAIHLALVPGHEESPASSSSSTASDSSALALGVFTTTWWRRPAALWLSATIVAYLVWVMAGWEAPDQVGIACKLIELVALGLVMRLKNPARTAWPRRLWRATAFPLLVSLTTIGIWIGGLAHPDALHAHAGAVLQPVASVATPEERVAAARLLADTKASLARYQDPAAAVAAGYKPGPVSDADPLLHFQNQANIGAVLDPDRPQALVYARTPVGLKLVGAMYQMPRVGQWGPDPGGPLTQWHQHEGICFSPLGFEFSFETPFWTCPVGSGSITTPPMLHVWIIDNGKSGPFAAELDKAARHQLTGRS